MLTAVPSGPARGASRTASRDTGDLDEWLPRSLDDPLQWADHGCGLSIRESQVMYLITRGLSNDDMAARMHLGTNTVKTYVKAAYRKTGVSTRAEAVLWGVEHGLHPGLGPRPVPRRSLRSAGAG